MENNMPKKSESNLTTARNEVTKKKIHKHLVDINDVITEKDIENVSTAGSAGYDKLNNEEKKVVKKEVKKVTGSVNQKNKKNKADGNNEPGIETSWNVLGGG
jgi:hypothetical protein